MLRYSYKVQEGHNRKGEALDENTQTAQNLMMSLEREIENNTLDMPYDPAIEARDTVFDAIQYALDNGWKP